MIAGAKLSLAWASIIGPAVLALHVLEGAGVEGLVEARNGLTPTDAVRILGFIASGLAFVWLMGWRVQKILQRPHQRLDEHFIEENSIHRKLVRGVARLRAAVEVLFEHQEPPIPHSKVAKREREILAEVDGDD
jgi:hypothetical protein